MVAAASDDKPDADKALALGLTEAAQAVHESLTSRWARIPFSADTKL